MLIKIANVFENISKKLRAKVRNKEYKKFMKKFGLIESEKTKKTDKRFNPYERTDFCLIKELIKSKYITKTDYILDIGCGAGLFLSYLASNGFENLCGIELNPKLFKIANENAIKMKIFTNKDIKINQINALEFKDIDEFNVFYLFNTFYDKDTYIEWLKIVENSLKRTNRTIRIIILFPTISSMGAIAEFNWLKEKNRVIYKSQPCWRCVNFLIYEGKL